VETPMGENRVPLHFKTAQMMPHPRLNETEMLAPDTIASVAGGISRLSSWLMTREFFEILLPGETLGKHLFTNLNRLVQPCVLVSMLSREA